MKRSPIAALFALAFLFFFSASPPGRAHDDEREFEGTLTAVNTVDGTVTVGGLVFGVTSGTDIEINDAHGSLADLAAFIGQTAEVEFLEIAGSRVATEIEVETEEADEDEDGDPDDEDEDDVEIRGVVTHCEQHADGTIHVIVRSNGHVFDFVLNSSTEVEIEDADIEFEDESLPDVALLCDLLDGAVVEVEFDPETLVVKEIEVEARLAVVVGTIVAVDGDGTITVRRGSKRTFTFELLPGTVVVSGSRLMSHSDLRVGGRVQARLFRSNSGERFAVMLRLVGRRR